MLMHSREETEADGKKQEKEKSSVKEGTDGRKKREKGQKKKWRKEWRK
jgi:hypothetical protein